MQVAAAAELLPHVLDMSGVNSVSYCLCLHPAQYPGIACVRSVMLHASECWAPTKKDTDKLGRTDRSMLRWICNVRLSDRVRVDTLLQTLNLQPIETLVRACRLRWLGMSPEGLTGITVSPH